MLFDTKFYTPRQGCQNKCQEKNKKPSQLCNELVKSTPPSHILYGWLEDFMCVSVTGEVENQLSLEETFEKLYFTCVSWETSMIVKCAHFLLNQFPSAQLYTVQCVHCIAKLLETLSLYLYIYKVQNTPTFTDCKNMECLYFAYILTSN